MLKRSKRLTTGWEVAETRRIIPVDLKSYPLQIRTTSDLGSNDFLIYLYHNIEPNWYKVEGYIVVLFEDLLEVRISIYGCNETELSFQATREEDEIWTIAKTMTHLTMEEKKIQLQTAQKME